MKCIFIFLLSITLSLAACDFASAADKFFPMGVWYEGGVGAARQFVIPEDVTKAAAQYDRDFADIAAHGINVVVVPNTPPKHHQALLDAANKHGLKLIIEMDLDGGKVGQAIRKGPVDEEEIRKYIETTLGPIKTNPALWRVQLLDEPPAGSFERYRKVADILKQYDPNMPPFCCLAGSGAVINDFCKVVHPDVACWDAYPLGRDSETGNVAPLRGFAMTAQNAALVGAKYNAAVWGVIQCHDLATGLRMPSAAEVRCMSWSALAGGSKGIYWFLYQTEWFDPQGHSKMRGLVNEQYQPSDRWDEVGKLTKEISALSPILMDDLTPIPAAKGSDFSTMLLKDSHGTTYAFVINFDTLHPQKVVAHAAGREGGSVVRVSDGKAVQTEQIHGEFTWTTDLEPGDCAVFRLE
jgi:hypothetical protein